MTRLPPQAIRRPDDGSFVVLNVALGSLDVRQRVAVGIQVWDQVRALMEANGDYRPRDPRKAGVKTAIGTTADIDWAVADAVGVAHDDIKRVRPRLQKRPDLVARLLAGEFESLNDLQRELGLIVISKIEEGRRSLGKYPHSHFSRGDKFDGAIEPLKLYLRAWEKREFKFSHVPPRTARKRVAQIDRLLAQLEGAKADLVRRSYVATSRAPQERKENRT